MDVTPKKLKKLRSKRNVRIEPSIETIDVYDDFEEMDLSFKETNDTVNEQIKGLHTDKKRLSSTIQLQADIIQDLYKKIDRLKSDSKLTIESPKLTIDNLSKEFESQTSGMLISNDSVDIIEHITGQLQDTKAKLFEALNQNALLKNDLKIAQKCIEQEIGEAVNLTQLSNANSSWRGRSQQILSLQAKISELKGKTVVVSDDIRKIEAARKIDRDQTMKELTISKKIINEQRSKINAFRARNKTLNEEMLTSKMKAREAEAKLHENEQLLQEADQKIKSKSLVHERALAELAQLKEIAEEQSKKKLDENQSNSQKIEELRTCVKQKNELIESMKLEMDKLQNELKSNYGEFMYECREFQAHEFMAIVDVLQSEKNDLIDQVQQYTQRLEVERNENRKYQDELGKQKIKCAKLDSKYKQCQREKDTLDQLTKRTRRIANYSNKPKYAAAELTKDIDSLSHFELGLKIEELENRLLVSSERIVFLEDNLAELDREKKEDSATFEAYVIKSKQMLVECLAERKKKTSAESMLTE